MFDIQGDWYKSGIYQIYNKITNKRYIGSSISMRRRWSQHLFALRHNQHHSKHLQAAWNKYGEDSFEFKCLELCEPENLLSLEHEYILYYKTTDRQFGYNTTEDVENAPFLTKEGRIKLSKALTGRKWTEEQRQKFINSRKGKKSKKCSDTKKRQLLEGVLKITRITDVSEDKQAEWKRHISEGRKRYFASNTVVKSPILIQSDDFTMCFPTVKKAAEYLEIDACTLRKYALKKGRRNKKIPYEISYISKEEYNQYKNV